MKCTLAEISWHNREPVYSIDFQCSTSKNIEDGKPFWRLATGGNDSHVLIWHLTVNELGSVSITSVADLERHQKSVNVVRFSPSGDILATGDDESIIILWKLKEASDIPPLPGDENQNKEQWTSWKVLRGHLGDIYDLSWSPDSNYLVSGSIDNSSIIWDIQKGRSTSISTDYKGFVQGVTWDPCNQYVATLSADRQCRLIDLTTMKIIQRVNKAKLPTPVGHQLDGKILPLFHDDTIKTYFRRLTFSIDGSLIIAPSGIIENDGSNEKLYATMVFSRYNLKEPIMILPTLHELPIAVRCCPVYFEIRKDGPVPIISLPYRLIFAVAAEKTVMIYDTQQLSPLAVITDFHYARLNDVAWTSDGKILVVSSSDGYCSIVLFQDGELGTVYKEEKSLSMKHLTIGKESKKQPDKLTDCKDKKEAILAECQTDAMDIDITDKVNVAFCTPNLVDKEKKEKDDKARSGEVFDGSQDIKLIYSETSTMENVNITSVKTSVSNGDDTTTRKTNDEPSTAKTTPPKNNDTSTGKTTPTKAGVAQVLLNKTPRRVKLITLSSPKRTKHE